MLCVKSKFYYLTLKNCLKFQVYPRFQVFWQPCLKHKTTLALEFLGQCFDNHNQTVQPRGYHKMEFQFSLNKIYS